MKGPLNQARLAPAAADPYRVCRAASCPVSARAPGGATCELHPLWADDASTAEFDQLELGAVLPDAQFVFPEEAAAGAGEAAVGDAGESGELVDGSDRAVQADGDVFDTQERAEPTVVGWARMNGRGLLAAASVAALGRSCGREARWHGRLLRA